MIKRGRCVTEQKFGLKRAFKEMVSLLLGSRGWRGELTGVCEAIWPMRCRGRGCPAAKSRRPCSRRIDSALSSGDRLLP